MPDLTWPQAVVAIAAVIGVCFVAYQFFKMLRNL